MFKIWKKIGKALVVPYLTFWQGGAAYFLRSCSCL